MTSSRAKASEPAFGVEDLAADPGAGIGDQELDEVGGVVRGAPTTVGEHVADRRMELTGRIAGVEGVATREVPAKVMLRVARLMELWSKITGKAPLTTYKNSLYVLQEHFVDASKAVTELGMPQSPIEQAIEDSINWFRENGYV